MARIVLLLKAAAGLFAFALYVWYAAVRRTPEVKRRKRERRRRALSNS